MLLDIFLEVCAIWHVTPEEMCSRSRLKHVCSARQALWYRLRYTCDFSYKALAEFFERDYTSIIAGVKKHAERLAELSSGAPALSTTVAA